MTSRRSEKINSEWDNPESIVRRGYEIIEAYEQKYA
jgi:hypothetical protein